MAESQNNGSTILLGLKGYELEQVTREDEGEIFLGIDEHSFKHQDMVHTVTEVEKKRVIVLP